MADHPLKWELPGGKLEKGETALECIHRELKEELEIKVEIVKSFPAVDHDYPTKKIHLVAFLCQPISSKIVVKEHAAIRWIEVDDLMNLDWSEADRQLLFKIKDEL